MISSMKTAAVMAAIMIGTSVLASAAKPTRMLADTRQQQRIEPLIPLQFGTWRAVPVTGGIVNPQVEDFVNKVYSETVSKIYENDRGERIILSIAYGKNQGDDFQVHKPEVCYPAQGFEVRSNQKGQLQTASGSIPVRRLETVLGRQRFEPVTYWTTLGDFAVASGIDKKMLDIRYAMDGLVADGLLFRVSSIDRDSPRAFALHEQFARDLLAHVGAGERRRLAGLAQ